MTFRTLFSFALSVALTISLALHSAVAEAAKSSLLSASAGIPDIADGPLNEESFAAVTTRRIKNAKVAWVNVALLREMGIEVPAKMTPEFEKLILDSFAYIIPDGISESKLSPEEKVFYADRYGGSGGTAYGSGRAMAAGRFQIKGGGRTPLVSKDLPQLPTSYFNPRKFLKEFEEWFSEKGHSHGGLTLNESMVEAIWGEVLHKELPYGANRVVCILTTDLWIGHFNNEPRAIMVRENSIRPAHFMRNNVAIEDDPAAEKARIQRLNKNIIQFFGQIAGLSQDASDAEKLAAGQKAFIEKVANKYATEYVHSFFHGSTSPSNIEFDGRAIDHGPMTALDGFTKAISADVSPNGSLTYLREELLNQFFIDLRRTISGDLIHEVLLVPEVKAILAEAFDKRVSREFLWLTGAPESQVDRLAKLNSGKNLAELLKKMAKSGNRKIVNVRVEVPEDMGKFSIHEILKISANSSHEPSVKLNEVLISEIPDFDLRMEFIQKYRAFLTDYDRVMTGEGITRESARKFLKTAVDTRAKTFPSLMRRTWRWVSFYYEIFKVKVLRMNSSIAKFINRTVDNNSRPKDLPGDRLVVEHKNLYDSATQIRKIFDPKTEQTYFQIVAPLSEGKIAVGENLFSLAEVKRRGLTMEIGGIYMGGRPASQTSDTVEIALASPTRSLEEVSLTNAKPQFKIGSVANIGRRLSNESNPVKKVVAEISRRCGNFF